MNRFFKYVQRFNSLLPLLAILCALVGISWAIWQDRGRHKAPEDAPSVTIKEEKYYFLRQEQYLEKNGIWIFDLHEGDKQERNYQTGPYKTNNLLLIADKQQTAHWLFKDQTQYIHQFEAYPKDDSVFAKVLYIEVTPISQMDDAANDDFTIYLTKLNGDKPVMMLSHVDKVISHNFSGKVLQIIYQQGLTVMRAQIDIDNFKIRSNREVANLTGVPSK